MAISVSEQARGACRGSALPLAQRAILWLLADKANSTTHLAWPGYESLRDLTGLATSTISSGIAALEHHGMISTYRRPGKVPLYLVHPAGLEGLLPCDEASIMTHLSNGAFTDDERREICGWSKRIRREATSRHSPAALDPSDERKGRQGELIHTLPGSGGDHTDYRKGTPPMSGTEPSLNHHGTRKADHRPADLNGQADDRQVPKKAAPAAQADKERRRAERERWIGEPLEVRDRLVAEGGRGAERLRSMSDDEAVAEIEAMQLTLRICPAGDGTVVPFGAPAISTDQTSMRDQMGELD